jgi:response regulator of citrate/malate metabolism
MPKVNCILLVEDDEMSQHIIEQVIKRTEGVAHLEIAENGLKAIQYLEKAVRSNSGAHVPELILLDMHMPVMGGQRFLEEYVARFSKKMKCCIYPFVNNEPGTETFSLPVPICGYIEKPVTLDRMEKVLEETLEVLGRS